MEKTWNGGESSWEAGLGEWKNSIICLPKNILMNAKTLYFVERQKLNLLEGFESRYIWNKANTAFHEKNITVVVWGSGAALLFQDDLQ